MRQLLRKHEVAEALGIRPSMVTELPIPVVKISARTFRWCPEDVAAYKAETGDKPSRLALSLIAAGRQYSGNSSVYFIKCQRFVKIGVSTMVCGRLQTLQCATPLKLHLVGQIPGDATTEQAIHDLLMNWRHINEWFRLTPDLRKAIKTVCEVSGVFHGFEMD